MDMSEEYVKLEGQDLGIMAGGVFGFVPGGVFLYKPENDLVLNSDMSKSEVHACMP